MRIAIIEDMDENIALLENYLHRYEEENDTLITVASYKNGMEFITGYHPVWDLILLDIEMPLMDGMETARKIRKVDPNVLIIFITCMAQYAIDGYSVRALDYVLKPVHYYSFASKLHQVHDILASRKKRNLLITTRKGQVRLSPEDILYIEVQNHTLFYHTKTEVLQATGNQSLSKLSQELTDSGFSRCHQAYLVNLQYVARYDKNTVWLPGEQLSLSRSYYKDFVRALLTFCSREGNL